MSSERLLIYLTANNQSERRQFIIAFAKGDLPSAWRQLVASLEARELVDCKLLGVFPVIAK